MVDLYTLHPGMGPDGWYFSGEGGSLPADPLYGFKLLRDLYEKADPAFSGRVTVPVLWDKKTHTIVNNESSEIIRMFATAFDNLIPEHLREANRPGGGLYPPSLRRQIDELNEWVYRDINDGTYKAGFAASQEAYDSALYPLFAALDRVEAILSSSSTTSPGQKKYLVGDHLTEADVRLYATIARFDVAYYPIFHCNLKLVRHDYPAIYLWFRRLYWDDESEVTRGAFFRTTAPMVPYYPAVYALGRRFVVMHNQGPVIVPRGPAVYVDPLPEE